MKSPSLESYATAWSEVPAASLKQWSSVLESTACHYRQFPFWVRAHEAQGYAAKFFCCGNAERPTAFVAVIETGIFPFRFALIDRGPFLFVTEKELASACISSLFEFLKKQGYVFARFTQGQEMAFASLAALEGVTANEPFPFCRDSRNSLIVDLKEDENEMLAGFNSTVRNEIRRGFTLGYDIRATSSESDFELAWSLFERLATRKRFQLSATPKAVWKEAVRRGSNDNLARLYLCFYAEKLIAAQIIIRDGNMGELTLAALDTENLEVKPGPAALLNWIAMRDCLESGCKYYNLGGPGDPKRNNHVFEFKKKFKPTLQVNPGPLRLVFRKRLYWVWVHVFLRGWRVWKNRKNKPAGKQDC